MTRAQHVLTYRYDAVRAGQVTLTIERGPDLSHPGPWVVEVRRAVAVDLRRYRLVEYPDAHNARAHAEGGDVAECPTCSGAVGGF